jgi:hypothetical protein
MSDISAFILNIKNKYTSDIEVTHSSKIEDVITYCNFSLQNVIKPFPLSDGYSFFFSPFDQLNSINSIASFGVYLEITNSASKNLKYCIIKRDKYFLFFPSILEEKIYNDLARLERLRAFL